MNIDNKKLGDIKNENKDFNMRILCTPFIW